MKLLICFSIVFLVLSPPAEAQIQGEDAYGARFSYQDSASAPVIVLDQDHGLRSNGPDTPLLRIYGDGSVVVYFPEYRPNAGEYRMQISQEELTDLVALLSEKGMMTFVEARVKQEKAELENEARALRAQNGQPVLFSRSDDTLTVIEISLDGYQAAEASQAISDFEKRVAWYGAAHDARQYPSFEEIGNLMDVVSQLMAFTTHSNLRKMQ